VSQSSEGAWPRACPKALAKSALGLVCEFGKTRLELVYSFTGLSMETVNIYDAKTRLSQLVDKAASGEDVVVSRNGKPLVRITQLQTARRQIKFGVLKGKLTLGSDFDAPLPDAVLAGFEGR
jgi:prevent-host-death family protein